MTNETKNWPRDFRLQGIVREVKPIGASGKRVAITIDQPGTEDKYNMAGGVVECWMTQSSGARVGDIILVSGVPLIGLDNGQRRWPRLQAEKVEIIARASQPAAEDTAEPAPVAPGEAGNGGESARNSDVPF